MANNNSLQFDNLKFEVIVAKDENGEFHLRIVAPFSGEVQENHGLKDVKELNKNLNRIMNSNIKNWEDTLKPGGELGW